MSRFLSLIVFVLALQNAWAQDSFSEDEDSVETESQQETAHELVAPGELESSDQYQEERINLQKFDEGKWKAIVGDKDYSEKPGEKDTSKPLSLPWAGPLLKVIAYVVIIGLVVFLVWYITKNMTFDLRIERNKLQTADLEKPVENIDALDIDRLLAQARSEGNFRMAIRLCYLGLLKKLNAAGLISWKKDKTNRDYLSELFLTEVHYKQILRLTISYEAVWYGEHSLKGESLEWLSKDFEHAYREFNAAKTL